MPPDANRSKHGAADAFYDWPSYGDLVGAWFRRHPPVQRAWYDFRTNPRGRVRVLGEVS